MVNCNSNKKYDFNPNFIYLILCILYSFSCALCIVGAVQTHKTVDWIFSMIWEFCAVLWLIIYIINRRDD